MRQYFFIYILFLLIAGSVQYSIAQTIVVSDIPDIEEQLTILTDRSIYATNEEINFRADYSSSADLEKHQTLSSVLYLEIITSEGLPLLQHKYKLSPTGINEQITLPESIQTGQYLIKAYTKWMRNFSPADYAYCPITIVNPNSKNRIKQEKICSSGILYKSSESILNLRLNDTIVGKRESVRVSFEQEAHYSNTPHTISVVRKGAKTDFNFDSIALETQVDSNSTELFYPEINEMVLSGTVVNLATKTGEENISLHLTLMNGQPFFAATTSATNGRFYFTLPHLSGIKDFFISADSKDKNLSINLDGEYCQKPLKICSTDDNKDIQNKSIEQIMINAQLNARFAINDTISSLHKKSNLSFYGSPTRIINTHKYIDLPYIEEFILELIPEFSVYQRRGETIVKTKEKNTFSPFPVLLLIDNTPVYEKNKFLKIRTNKIETIEIVDRPYLVGDHKYNGIINAKTAKHDFAGIDLPENSMFFSYQFYTTEKQNEVTKAVTDSRIPDRRNCLYWNPEFYPKNGTGEFTFSTTDVPGTYQVIIQYLNSKNELITTTTDFVVQ